MKTVYIKLLLIAVASLLSINESISLNTPNTKPTEARAYTQHIVERFATRWWYYFWAGDYRSSLKKLNLTLQLIELQDLHQIAEFYNRMGMLHNDLGNDKQAGFYFNRALEVVQVDSGTLARLRTLQSFLTLYASGGMEQFDGVMDIGMSLRDSLILKQYGVKEKLELLAQKTEGALRKRTTILLLIVIIGLIIALTVFVILFYRSEKRKTAIMKQEYAITVRHYEELLELKKQIKIQQNNSDNTDEKVDESKQLASDIQQLFETEKIYRQQGLSVDDVATRLQISSRLLSNTINQHYQKNFMEYVNTFRIEEAIEMLKQQNKGGKYAHFTIQAIGEEVGFNGKSTFYRTFSRIVGVTPSEYIENINAKRENDNSEE